MKETVGISTMSNWDNFILPSKIALSTDQKLKQLNKGQLQILVPVGNLLRNNEGVQERLAEVRFYATSDSGKLKNSSVFLKEKLEKALYMKELLEKTVQGTHDRDRLRMEIADLCRKQRKKVNLRHQDFVQTTSPLAVHKNDFRNRGLKRGRDE
ncbi:uncharacterized protein LOC123306348 [Coccinella septempunctata]|uniref:uncharacterized protein LOC123306348 n=1 Tax=Coccinella septempunctata TaxID=41139 RepID=UPI001D06D205|nr:uncharacterized protein LOC123306348 [Coccinella septempunctata]